MELERQRHIWLQKKWKKKENWAEIVSDLVCECVTFSQTMALTVNLVLDLAVTETLHPSWGNWFCKRFPAGSKVLTILSAQNSMDTWDRWCLKRNYQGKTRVFMWVEEKNKVIWKEKIGGELHEDISPESQSYLIPPFCYWCVQTCSLRRSRPLCMLSSLLTTTLNSLLWSPRFSCCHYVLIKCIGISV